MTKTQKKTVQKTNDTAPPAPEAPIMPGLQQQAMLEIGRIAEYGELVRVADLAARMEAYRPGCAFAEALEALRERGNLEAMGDWVRVRMEGEKPMAEVVARLASTLADAPNGLASQEATSTLVSDPSDLPVELARDLSAELEVLSRAYGERGDDVELWDHECGRMLRTMARKAALLAELIAGVVA